LSYGNHEIKEKKELISKLPKLNKPIRMSRIALVEVDEYINLWKILESFDLNQTRFKSKQFFSFFPNFSQAGFWLSLKSQSGRFLKTNEIFSCLVFDYFS